MPQTQTDRATRRRFLASSGAAGLGSLLTYSPRPARAATSPNERPAVAHIGVGGNGQNHQRFRPWAKHADVVAVADVDSKRFGEYAAFRADRGYRTDFDTYADYRELLERNDLDAVFISTPDHWHVKVAIDAMRAGKDVYCEKPATLTVDEGKVLLRTLEETGRVLQVGTQQRSDARFQTAVALVRSGRIGKLKRVTAAVGAAPVAGPFPTAAVPPTLDWDTWQGQTPDVAYRAARCHYTFRWWHEYSGGKMTDWGAHHVDIAQWAIDADGLGPTAFEVLNRRFPVEHRDGRPLADDRYNCATRFHVKVTFPEGTPLHIRDTAKDLGFVNGILFEGERGRFFVNRKKLTGAPVEALDDDPLPESALTAVRKGRAAMPHGLNFFASIDDRVQPLSDAASHCRHLNTCHLANIALRLDRSLRWNQTAGRIIDDPEATTFLAREQRAGFEVI